MPGFQSAGCQSADHQATMPRDTREIRPPIPPSRSSHANPSRVPRSRPAFCVRVRGADAGRSRISASHGARARLVPHTLLGPRSSTRNNLERIATSRVASCPSCRVVSCRVVPQSHWSAASRRVAVTDGDRDSRASRRPLTGSGGHARDDAGAAGTLLTRRPMDLRASPISAQFQFHAGFQSRYTHSSLFSTTR